jgi:TRAP-type C4-dicarboxylate transport system permease large subunit
MRRSRSVVGFGNLIALVGFLTPPLGVNVFVASAISKVSIEDVSRQAIKFVLILLAFVMLIIPVRWISTVGYRWGAG